MVGGSGHHATQAQLARGQRLQEVLKQSQYQPLSLEHQVVALFAATQGFADRVPVTQVKAFQAAALREMDTSHPELLADIATRKEITRETEAGLRKALETFGQSWQAPA